jgi:hypothetical protein
MANRSLTTRFAHLLERVGLAMAGASCGLFVAAHLARTGIELVASIAAIFIMTTLGAVGFYLGIDIPPHTALAGKVDTAELLSAIGTFIAAISGFASVYIIVTDASPQIFSTLFVGFLWLLGVGMQIIAGAIARIRALG